MNLTEPTVVPVTEAVRCDRCGARAIAVSHHGTAELGWCGHHLRAHADALRAAGAEWRRIAA
jgi:hypothetical protein